MSAPIILVPGFWLGAWAWDEVAARLRADGHDVTAITLPGLESDADRSSIALRGPRRRDRPTRSRRPTSRSCSPSTARPGSPATRRATASRSGSRRWSTSTPRRGSAPLDPDFAEAEKPLVGRSSRPRRTSTASPRSSWRRSASARYPSRAASCASAYALTNDARLDIPSTLICTGFTAADYQKYAAGAPGVVVARGDPRAPRRHLDRPADEPLADVVAPAELAAIIGEVATRTGR